MQLEYTDLQEAAVLSVISSKVALCINQSETDDWRKADLPWAKIYGTYTDDEIFKSEMSRQILYDSAGDLDISATDDDFGKDFRNALRHREVSVEYIEQFLDNNLRPMNMGDISTIYLGYYGYMNQKFRDIVDNLIDEQIPEDRPYAIVPV